MWQGNGIINNYHVYLVDGYVHVQVTLATWEESCKLVSNNWSNQFTVDWTETHGDLAGIRLSLSLSLSLYQTHLYSQPAQLSTHGQLLRTHGALLLYADKLFMLICHKYHSVAFMFVHFVHFTSCPNFRLFWLKESDLGTTNISYVRNPIRFVLYAVYTCNS